VISSQELSGLGVSDMDEFVVRSTDLEEVQLSYVRIRKAEDGDGPTASASHVRLVLHQRATFQQRLPGSRLIQYMTMTKLSIDLYSGLAREQWRC